MYAYKPCTRKTVVTYRARSYILILLIGLSLTKPLCWTLISGQMRNIGKKWSANKVSYRSWVLQRWSEIIET